MNYKVDHFIFCHPESAIRQLAEADEGPHIYLLKSGILRGIYTERSECAQNDTFLIIS